MTGVSSVNLSYTTDALKYINGSSVYKDTIMNDVTGAFGAVPSNAAFMGVFYTGGQLLKSCTRQGRKSFNKTCRHKRICQHYTKYIRYIKKQRNK